MSHEIMWSTYSEKVDRKKVQAEWDAHVRIADRGEGASGASKIRWLDSLPICDGYEAAEKLIAQNDKGFFDCLAVRYYGVTEPTNGIVDARQKANAAWTAYNDANAAIHYKGVKSAFVSCKNCGSKLSTQYLNTNWCPLCRHDLRPESARARLAARKKKAEAATKNAHEVELKEAKKKRNVMWLVKIEYHT